ncbi:hypothetical protein ACJMK2_007589 [Sinanodonta woodiana]|uniref:C-type lectin domain-containing protein n=1 Tax=Sinanodonta woodiana TaxID=1069815 RepID=A0ABD3VIZ0_SINWO
MSDFAVIGIAFTCSCPAAWIQHGDSCYHFSHDKESWGEAFTFCKILGGYLVEIGTEGEAKYIENQVNMFNDKYWVGASDVLVEGEYIWMTSMTNVSYANWGPGQPDNSGTNENCVEIWTSKEWNDGPCSNTVRYICESDMRLGFSRN